MYGSRAYSRTEFVIDASGWGKEVPRRCSHNGPIPTGSVMYCEECGDYGRRHDKRLVIDERERPRPEPKVAPDIEPDPEPTRSQKAGKPTSGKMARRRAAKKLQATEAA